VVGGGGGVGQICVLGPEMGKERKFDSDFFVDQMANLTIVAVSGTTTIPTGQSEVAYMVDASAGGFTITLPDATGDDGDHFYIKRLDGVVVNPVTISAHAGQKIDGSSSISLTKNKFYHLLCFNGSWSIIG
jgi:hypothetical protein